MPKLSINGTTHYVCDTCGYVQSFFGVIGSKWALIRPVADRKAAHADPFNEEVFICHCPWCRARLTVLEGRDPEELAKLPPMIGGRVEVFSDGRVESSNHPVTEFVSKYPKELSYAPCGNCGALGHTADNCYSVD